MGHTFIILYVHTNALLPIAKVFHTPTVLRNCTDSVLIFRDSNLEHFYLLKERKKVSIQRNIENSRLGWDTRRHSDERVFESRKTFRW